MKISKIKWQEVQSELKSIGINYGIQPEVYPLQGHNFITDTIVCRKQLKSNENAYFQLCYGSYIDDWLLCVAFIDFRGNDYWEDSKLCYSFEEVIELLTKVSFEGFSWEREKHSDPS